MKTPKMSKLKLNKITISDLSPQELAKLKGGYDGSIFTDIDYTCKWGTYQEYCTGGRNCTYDSQCQMGTHPV